ncbi:MAG: type VI secretion protein [Candidatus Limivicinus sp.]|nr:type VI secretion protein [Clostridiales bacterium]MDY6132089.1 type VI secretion protein [Candidatus Limivicinus sp.]
MIAPGVVRFNTDNYLCGNTFRCVWALREYPAATEDQAILRHLGEKDGVTLHIYTRIVDAMEEDRIIQNATNKNKMNRANTDDTKQMVTAEGNLQDVYEMVNSMRKKREPLIHCAVFIELCTYTSERLDRLQSEVISELMRAKLNVDRLRLRQQQGFCCVRPGGYNVFGPQFERVLPASSVANLYPYNYSGKTDAHGFYVGKDKYGSNILVDLDQRDEDKTSASVLILGNSGQGKSYLMKLLMLNVLEAGKSVISLDVEHEQKDMCEAVGGCFVDLMGGKHIINVLEPKCWSTGEEDDDTDAPDTFRCRTLLSQHLSFLRDFFRSYKDFTDKQIDTIEILLTKLYEKYGISDFTNFHLLRPEDYPTLSDLYDLIEEEYKRYDEKGYALYTAQLLREVLLGLHSICKGADSRFFNGFTNITSSRFLVFGVKSLLMAGKNVRNAMLFNVLSYMSDKLLTEGSTVATLDELYIWLSNPTAIEYIRNCLKRVRKKESAIIMASQNLEDFDQEGVREMTKPLFSIPPHQFLFNAGSIDKRYYMDMLQLEESEYDLIRYPQQGVCLYKCGNERYLLEVSAPPYKEALFGTAGGR